MSEIIIQDNIIVAVKNNAQIITIPEGVTTIRE